MKTLSGKNGLRSYPNVNGSEFASEVILLKLCSSLDF
jgi:hypothetical protein